MLKLGLSLLTATLLVGCSSKSHDPQAPSGQTARSSAPVSQAPSASAPSTSARASARIGQPFVNHGFKVVVSKVELGLRALPESAKPGARASATKAQNGQFVLVFVSVTNVTKSPQTFAVGGNSMLHDSKGRQFIESQAFPDDAYGFGDLQQPDTTTTGFLSFDVPLSVTAVASIDVQADPITYEKNPPTTVELR